MSLLTDQINYQLNNIPMKKHFMHCPLLLIWTHDFVGFLSTSVVFTKKLFLEQIFMNDLKKKRIGAFYHLTSIFWSNFVYRLILQNHPKQNKFLSQFS